MSELHDQGVIVNPLTWQAEMDKAECGINLKGSSRFWLTVATLWPTIGAGIYRDGAPEFGRIVIPLQFRGNIGLELTTDIELAHMDYRFVDYTKFTDAG